MDRAQELARTRRKAHYRAVKAALRTPPPRLPRPPADPAAAVAAWAERELVVPSGLLQGRPFKLQRWQVDWLRGAFGAREAGLSVARKNGKSGLVAALILSSLLGPLRRRNLRIGVVSLTGRLAQELWHQCREIAEASGFDSDDIVFRKVPQPGQILGNWDGSRVDILASDKATGHASGFDLCLIDEAGLLQEDKRDLWSACLSSVSGRDGKLWAISIRGDGPMFAELAARHDDPAVYWREWAAEPELALDNPDAWAAANPALGTLKSASYLQDAARRALASPSDQAMFKAQELNLPQAPTREMICSVADWEANIVDELPPRRGPVMVGLDLGGSSSMTAAVLIWPQTMRVESFGAFPADPDLKARGQADACGTAYQRMQERGELQVFPGRVTDVGLFLAFIIGRLRGSRATIACDRYRRAEAQDALQAAGYRGEVVYRGQGASATADGSADVRAAQRLILAGRLRSRRSLLVGQAIASSVIVRDSGGNPKIKAHGRGRIDALAALVLACGLAERTLARPRTRRSYLGRV